MIFSCQARIYVLLVLLSAGIAALATPRLRDHAGEPRFWRHSACPSADGLPPPSLTSPSPARTALAFAVPGTSGTAWRMCRLLVAKTLHSVKVAYLWLCDKSLVLLHQIERRKLRRQGKKRRG